MKKQRDQIKTVRQFEKFLRRAGFSRREGVILARAFRDLPVLESAQASGCKRAKVETGGSE